MPQPEPAAEPRAEPVPAIAPEDFGVLVGWRHHDSSQGINLSLQSARSQAAWSHGTIDTRHYLMTRNQALLLARYLLEATGQTLPEAVRPRGWRALRERLRRA
jgi:hypothetical protein